MSDYKSKSNSNYNNNYNSNSPVRNDIYTNLKEKFEEDLCNNMEIFEDKNKEILKSLEMIINKLNYDTSELKDLNTLKGKII
jgi:hypothetical protein